MITGLSRVKYRTRSGRKNGHDHASPDICLITRFTDVKIQEFGCIRLKNLYQTKSKEE